MDKMDETDKMDAMTMDTMTMDTMFEFPTLDDCPTMDELKKTLEEQENKNVRLMRNRASAKLSRERQRERLKYLSERCCFLENRNRELERDNVLLYNDNAAMHKKIYFRG